MKKIYFTLLIAFIYSVSFAQNFKAGIIGGLANTDILGTDAIDNDVDYNKVGFSLGIFAQLPINEKNNVELDMCFIQKGTYSPFPLDTSGNIIPYSHSYKLRLNYMEVPILFSHKFGFNIGKKSVDRFAVEIGPSIGFLVYAGENLDNVGFAPPVTTDPFKPFHNYDISGLIGLTYQIDENWKFHIRYENSLIAIRPHASGATAFNSLYLYYNPGQVNMVFNYCLSYTFGKGTPTPATIPTENN